MVEVATEFISQTIDAYNLFLESLPLRMQLIVNLFLLVLVVFAYAVFIWKAYKYIAQKNLIELNLNQYNRSEHPFLSKLITGGFYLLEYIIISPIVIFLGFSLFVIFLILLSEGANIATLLLIAATIVSVIRLASYIPGKGEDLAKDLAKMLPFMLLAASMLNPGFFDFERIINNFREIPLLIDKILIYLGFIVGLEIILRFFDFLFSLIGWEDIDETQTKEKQEINEKNIEEKV